ncbi:hypothetical protein NON00_23795 [Roseomonas sp. GC11]|uniref:hypothetical protein n=1 Tax=Roseomonas sp. GC11 TaxID=2950546 RepID=UPI00210A6FD7|nr:hypothetical protein [Roseomonas sp. GC11]MCQ4162928.1 hypothetical protein [Roseomonas sp. GC11]
MQSLARAGLWLGVVAVAAGCSPSYSPDTYASKAVQQANKVETGVIVGRRAVMITADGSTGAAAGAAAGGVAGTRVGGGDVTSAFAGIGGGLIGGLLGAATEKGVGSTDGFEYIVRKPNGEMVSVTQRDEKPLEIGLKVLVIAGAQARIVPDYTVAEEKPATPTPAAPTGSSAPAPAAPAQESLPAPTGESPPAEAPATPPAANPAATPSLPGVTLPLGQAAI